MNQKKVDKLRLVELYLADIKEIIADGILGDGDDKNLQKTAEHLVDEAIELYKNIADGKE